MRRTSSPKAPSARSSSKRATSRWRKGFYYAIWLYNSPTSCVPLSKSSAVGSKHRLAGGSPLPSNAAEFHEMLLTQETNPKPTHPGPVVLRGPLSLT